MHLTYPNSDAHTSGASSAEAEGAGAPVGGIRVTPAMIEAGVEIIAGYDNGFLTSDKIWVEQIYRAMQKARLEERRTARSPRSSG